MAEKHESSCGGGEGEQLNANHRGNQYKWPFWDVVKCAVYRKIRASADLSHPGMRKKWLEKQVEWATQKDGRRKLFEQMSRRYAAAERAESN